MSEIAPFAFEEGTRLLHDADVSAVAVAAIRAIREVSARPLLPFVGADGPLRKAAFATSLQGLSPRLSTLPDVGVLPAPLVDHLRAEARRCVARGERILSTLSRLRELLADAGIRAVPLKGAALVLRGEIPAGLRPMADIDLLLESEADVWTAAARIEEAMGYRPLWNTRRHLVLAQREESVSLWACEHPENPLRIELHRSFRLEVLGTVLDATDGLLRATEPAEGWAVPSREPLLRHLLFHAAEDFAAKGLRGVQAVDFLVLAAREGPLPVPVVPKRCLGPVVLAIDALERLFPGTFDAGEIERAAAEVSSDVRLRASSVPALRHSRPDRGWTLTSLGLVEGTLPQIRFLIRTLFPSLDEVKANVSPGATGRALAVAWARVLMGRLVSAARRLGRR